MKFYLQAVGEILKSWYLWIGIIVDLATFAFVFSKQRDLQPIIYIIIFGVCFVLASITSLAEKLKLLDDSKPLIVSNDNLSVGGPNKSIDSISLINIGNSIVKVTNISSDKMGKVRIIDDHYMETFLVNPVVQPVVPNNIMVNESKIINGLSRDNSANISPIAPIVERWKEPFFIYVWYQSLQGQEKFCTMIKFQADGRNIRNLGWKQIKVKK